MVRYLNMFVILGILLVLASLAGFATGGRFLTEAGSAPSPSTSWIYLGAGILMLLNGALSWKQMPAEMPSETKKRETQKI